MKMQTPKSLIKKVYHINQNKPESVKVQDFPLHKDWAALDEKWVYLGLYHAFSVVETHLHSWVFGGAYFDFGTFRKLIQDNLSESLSKTIEEEVAKQVVINPQYFVGINTEKVLRGIKKDILAESVELGTSGIVLDLMNIRSLYTSGKYDKERAIKAMNVAGYSAGIVGKIITVVVKWLFKTVFGNGNGNGDGKGGNGKKPVMVWKVEAFDGRLCNFCAALDGREVPEKGLTYGGYSGLFPPVHGKIYGFRGGACRCRIGIE